MSDMKGLLPFDASHLRELLHIYQTNYAGMQAAHNQLLLFVIYMVEQSGGEIMVDVARLEELQNQQSFEIRIEPQEDGNTLRLSVKGQEDGAQSEGVSGGPVSDIEPDGRASSDSG